eukprot:TRINITY_DN66483_c0_g1_i1.p1 TRINITY_DN66483_c0_g1~~TRINITY_DN66483_c0_g1_i1.p1  ORF type:complete len:218 (+),score=82.56 TRINITY_DN66483_c0_g1_i1:58-711(+)
MAAEPAPHLKEFFEFQIGQMKRLQEEIMPLVFDQEKMQAKVVELKEEMRKLTTPMLEKSFDHHDTKKSGVLDPEEAAVFFNHFIEKRSQFIESQIQQTVLNSINMASEMFGGSLEGEEKEKMQKEMDDVSKVTLNMINDCVKEFEEDYLANKEERDALAFKRLDVNNDGTLTRDEFLALFAEEEKMKALLEIFGWDEAKAQQKLGYMEARMQECQQQ